MLTTVMHSQRLRKLHQANTAIKLDNTMHPKVKQASLNTEAIAVFLILIAITVAMLALPLGT